MPDPTSKEPGRPETRPLPLLLPVVAFGGLIVVLVLAATLAGSRAPQRAARLYAEGDEKARAGKDEEAAALLGKAVGEDPALLAARCRLGEVLVRLGRPSEAVPHLELCLGGMEGGPAEERDRALRLLERALRVSAAPAAPAAPASPTGEAAPTGALPDAGAAPPESAPSPGASPVPPAAPPAAPASTPPPAPATAPPPAGSGT
jgi:hypothetical protein